MTTMPNTATPRTPRRAGPRVPQERAASTRAQSLAATSTPLLRVDGVDKSYRNRAGTVHAVRDVRLAARVGETVALLGPNGSGKSTLIGMLLGLTAPDRGTVSILGREPRAAVAAGLVGAMLQTGGSLIRDLSTREVIAMAAGLYSTPIAVDDALRLAGLEALRDRRTQKLSGGEVQRVRFAMALVGDPRLLILDEPTVAMDVTGRQAFWRAITALTARGTTVIFATHYLAEAENYADRAVLMAAGRIVADGRMAEIKAGIAQRTIRTTLEGAAADDLAQLPGVVSVARHGDSIVLRCSDADRALRALLLRDLSARDFEVTGADLEEAFVQLTRTDDGGAAR
jgi:ABC-2 type transport system ATP-binding protein